MKDDKLYLLPVQGSDTQWHQNVLKNPGIRIDARGAETEFQAIPITDAKQVSSVVEKIPRQVWDQRRGEVRFKVRRRRSCLDARNATMMETGCGGIPPLAKNVEDRRQAFIPEPAVMGWLEYCSEKR